MSLLGPPTWRNVEKWFEADVDLEVIRAHVIKYYPEFIDEITKTEDLRGLLYNGDRYEFCCECETRIDLYENPDSQCSSGTGASKECGRYFCEDHKQLYTVQVYDDITHTACFDCLVAMIKEGEGYAQIPIHLVYDLNEERKKYGRGLFDSPAVKACKN